MDVQTLISELRNKIEKDKIIERVFFGLRYTWMLWFIHTDYNDKKLADMQGKVIEEFENILSIRMYELSGKITIKDEYLSEKDKDVIVWRYRDAVPLVIEIDYIDEEQNVHEITTIHEHTWVPKHNN